VERCGVHTWAAQVALQLQAEELAGVFEADIAHDRAQQLFIVGEPQVEAVRGCCPPKTILSQKFLNPGEEATVSMNFSMHPGMDGQHEFRVHVRTTDPDNPDQEVVVLSNWVQQ